MTRRRLRRKHTPTNVNVKTFTELVQKGIGAKNELLTFICNKIGMDSSNFDFSYCEILSRDDRLGANLWKKTAEHIPSLSMPHLAYSFSGPKTVGLRLEATVLLTESETMEFLSSMKSRNIL